MDTDGRCNVRMATALLLLVLGPVSRAQTVRNLTNLPNDDFDSTRQAALDDAGSVVYAVSSSNQFGTNPRHSWQIFRWDPATGTGWQVTDFERGVGFGRSYYAVPPSISVSDDGQWLAFIDLVGMNHDGSAELYVMRPDASGIAQLTSDPAIDAGAVHGAMISGSGNRVVLVADTDPLGTNPGRHKQLFVVNLDGTGLRQLTSALTDPNFIGISISDDGSRILFSHREDLTGENPSGLTQVFAIEADGAGLRQLSHVTSGYALGPVISGSGTVAAFQTSGGVSKINWDGTGLVETPNAEAPSITDDGQTIFYRGAYPNYHVWKIAADGTQNTELTTIYGSFPVVSGGGSRVAFDGGEIMAMDSSGGNLRQLTVHTAIGYGHEPQVSDDGARVFFKATVPGASYQLFRIQADGTGLAQVTNITGGFPMDFVVSPDGNVVVFSDYTYGTSGHNVFRINVDGTGMTQITPTPPAGSYPQSRFPAISPDGQWVIFQSTLDAGLNTDGSLEVLRIKLDGTQLWSVTDDDDVEYRDKLPRLSDGSVPWIVYQSGSNKDSLNPDGSLEIFRTRITGTPVQRLTADPVYDSMEPDISANGYRVVYASEADPLGTNLDHNAEIFLYDVPSATHRQLTHTTSGASYKPRITRDGAWVYFRSSAPFFEPNQDGHEEPYRVSVSGGDVERLGGTRCCGASLWEGSSAWVHGDAISVDRAGTRAAFTGSGDWNGQNADRVYDVYVVDHTARPILRVGKSAPTLVSWDPAPKPVRYDVIRGDLASLRLGAGGTVDLGAVACIEDDSPDTTTSGFEDVLQPSSGEVLFYLNRGTQGLADGPGSWGQGSGVSERAAGAGTCAP